MSPIPERPVSGARSRLGELAGSLERAVPPDFALGLAYLRRAIAPF